MESMNKFKVLTVVIICMFLFIVAAIYSNTKDIAGSHMQKVEKAGSYDKKQITNSIKAGESVEALQSQVEFLNKRVDELSQKVRSTSSSMSCKIVGVHTSEGILRLSQTAAIEEAQDTGADLVITCSL